MNDAQVSAPLVPADCDLQDFPYMPVDVDRLLKSETWVLGRPDERAAAMALWLNSWHQVPAASLPDNDRMLGHLAQATAWKKVKEHALRGWIRCTDGRFYHPVVAEKALEAWIEKLLNSLSGATGNAKRWGVQIDTEATRLQLLASIDLLRALAPQSKTLRKQAVVKITAGSPPDIQPGSPPDDESDRPPNRPPTEKASGIVAIESKGRGINREREGAGEKTTLAGDACKAMRQAGLADVNPGHPELLALLEAGITASELGSAASDAVRLGKGFVYAMRMAQSRRRDAAKVGTLPAGTKTEDWTAGAI